MRILFFANTCSFDDTLDKETNVPAGAVEITPELRRSLLAGQSEGQNIAADKNGYPILVERPIPERDFLAEAILETERLRAIADYAIKPLQYAIDVDEATDADLASLRAWKKYYVSLTRVPTQAEYPKVVDWPAPPA